MNLTGVQSNINGIGARVSLIGPWGVQIRDVKAGESYGIQNTLTQHFGTGAVTSIDQVSVTWPSGEVDNFYNVAVDQTLTIEEGSGVSSLNELAARGYDVTLFPNPVSDVLTVDIETNKVVDGLLMQVFDVSGKKIEESIINQSLSTFDFSAYAQGVYRLSLTSEEGIIFSEEFVKD